MQKLNFSQNFLDLDDAFSNLANSKIVILPIGFDLTTSYQKGTDQGPSAVIESSKYLELYDIETDQEVYKLGIHTAAESAYTSSEQMIKDVQSQISSYLNKGKFVATIGGEHSISYPLIKAHAKHYKNLSILQLDAHADMHPALDDNPYSHGSVMKRVTELDHINNLVSIGIRSMAVEEKPHVNTSSTFFAHHIHDNSNWAETALNLLSDQVYITLDLDVFDSSIMPSTGTPEPGGLTWTQVMKFLKQVADKKKIVGFDVVELMPLPNLVAPNFLTSKLIYKLLSYIFEEK